MKEIFERKRLEELKSEQEELIDTEPASLKKTI